MKTDYTLAYYVYLIAELPPRPPILFDSQDEIALMDIERSFYKVISLWLRNIVLAEPLSPEAYRGSAQFYQPQAELLAAWLHLIIAVHRSSFHPAIQAFSSPAEFWYKYVASKAQQVLELNGFIGKPGLALGKRECLSTSQEICSLIESSKIDFDRSDIIPDRHPGTLIMVEAQTLAKADWNFYDNHLKPFIRIWRRTVKAQKNCKNLQNHFLGSDGKLYVTKKGGRMPKLPSAL